MYYKTWQCFLQIATSFRWRNLHKTKFMLFLFLWTWQFQTLGFLLLSSKNYGFTIVYRKLERSKWKHRSLNMLHMELSRSQKHEKKPKFIIYYLLNTQSRVASPAAWFPFCNTKSHKLFEKIKQNNLWLFLAVWFIWLKLSTVIPWL